MTLAKGSLFRDGWVKLSVKPANRPAPAGGGVIASGSGEISIHNDYNCGGWRVKVETNLGVVHFWAQGLGLAEGALALGDHKGAPLRITFVKFLKHTLSGMIKRQLSPPRVLSLIFGQRLIDHSAEKPQSSALWPWSSTHGL
jgi:hypothetical protein